MCGFFDNELCDRLSHKGNVINLCRTIHLYITIAELLLSLTFRTLILVCSLLSFMISVLFDSIRLIPCAARYPVGIRWQSNCIIAVHVS